MEVLKILIFKDLSLEEFFCAFLMETTHVAQAIFCL